MDADLRVKLLGPPNPIISKKLQGDDKASMTLVKEEKEEMSEKDDGEGSGNDSVSTIEGRLTLFNGYSPKSLVYQKYENKEFMTRAGRRYFSSLFVLPNAIPAPISTSSTSSLTFSAGGQSMNLFTVYQTGKNQYDLILQNDVNTGGYTQWFYFSILNTDKNRTYRFNIVNLYKTTSLYTQGMRPLVNSKRMNKGWRRTCNNITYNRNEINVEYMRKYYSTLSFQYTFPFENDETIFAHCYPYSWSNLKAKIKQLEQSPKVKTKIIGYTNMKKPLHMIHFTHDTDKYYQKSAIILLARQHPGETVGSYIVDQIMTQFTRLNNQNEFLLWKFDVYCFPMLNVDGVLLGNYRSNAYGFDLNRSWDKEAPNRTPELTYIKNEIRKIQKRQPIEMILDFHGHSRKLGSFFYGNPFGKNTGIFAYIASKNNSFISFQNSTFRKEKTDKTTTARIVLGQMIRETGAFYTLETSFYGGWKSGKKIHFTPEDYRQLGKTINGSMYKTFLELYKEEKTLRQTMFLREVKREIAKTCKLFEIQEYQSGSDSEAQFFTQKQFLIKDIELEQDRKKLKLQSSTEQIKLTSKKSIEIQVNNEDFPQVANSIVKIKHFQEKGSLKELTIPSHSLNIKLPGETKLIKSRSNANPADRKKFLMEKLRVFGETYIEHNPKDKNKETQTNSNIDLGIVGKSRASKDEGFVPPIKSQYRKQRTRNKSLMLQVNVESKPISSELVQISRLEYQKIQRNSVSPKPKRQRKLESLKYSAMLPTLT